MAQVILSKNFDQYPRQLLYLLRSPQIFFRLAKISDTESGAAQSAQFEYFNSKGIGLEQFLVKYRYRTDWAVRTVIFYKYGDLQGALVKAADNKSAERGS
jgi:hypothetical protein